MTSHFGVDLAAIFQRDFEDFSQINRLSHTYQRVGGNRATMYLEIDRRKIQEEEGSRGGLMTSEYRIISISKGRKHCIRKVFTACSVACPQATPGWSKSHQGALLHSEVTWSQSRGCVPNWTFELTGWQLWAVPRDQKVLAMLKSLEHGSETRQTRTQTPAQPLTAVWLWTSPLASLTLTYKMEIMGIPWQYSG